MKLFNATVLVAAVSAQTGNATLEATVAYETHAEFYGQLKLYLGQNCNVNTLTGRICDYKYLRNISGLQKGMTYYFALSQDVDPDNDQLLMTYRSNDEAIFSGLKLSINTGSTNRVIDLMNLEGGGDEFMAFDYDSRGEPCDSTYPRGTSCSFDQTFDFYSRKVKPHYSLLRGHVVKRQSDPLPAPWIGSPRATSQLKVTTGNDLGDGSNAPISIYYGMNCDSNLCEYNKVAELTPKDRGTEYSIWMTDFDWENDQLIIDYRDGDDLYIKGLTFDACHLNSCKSFDLTTFGTATYTGLAFDYEKPEHPCGTHSYGDYECQYDAVWDFKSMTKFMDNSVFVGYDSVFATNEGR